MRLSWLGRIKVFILLYYNTYGALVLVVKYLKRASGIKIWKDGLINSTSHCLLGLNHLIFSKKENIRKAILFRLTRCP
jgi:hypothetical protein